MLSKNLPTTDPISSDAALYKITMAKNPFGGNVEISGDYKTIISNNILIGWYNINTGAKNDLCALTHGAIPNFDPGTDKFGLYIVDKTDINNPKYYFTQSSKNSGVVYGKPYGVNQADEHRFVIGWDVNLANGKLYNDCIVDIQPVGASIPEFPTVAMPVAAVLGILFIFGRKKGDV